MIDAECIELARHILGQSASRELTRDLAQHIEKQVGIWLARRRPQEAPPGPPAQPAAEASRVRDPAPAGRSG